MSPKVGEQCCLSRYGLKGKKTHCRIPLTSSGTCYTAFPKGHPAHCQLTVFERVPEGMGTDDASAAETGQLASTQKQRLEMELENLKPSSALQWIYCSLIRVFSSLEP